jgi:hypothetical protein
MNKADVLSIARQQLSDAMCQDQSPICDPLKVSPWIAMSAPFKAIRRRQEQVALRAAARHCHGSSRRKEVPDESGRRMGSSKLHVKKGARTKVPCSRRPPTRGGESS